MTLSLLTLNATGSPKLARSNGEGLSTFRHAPFGADKLTGTATNIPGFNGQRRDPVSGSYHLGNGYRAYNPLLMRFNCPDNLSPFGAGGINPYAYCSGDPINRADPSGHISWQAGLGIGLGILGIIATAGTAAMAISAAGGISAALSAASGASLVAGGVSVAADVTGIASGAMEGSNPELSATLGWVSMGTGVAGMMSGAALGLMPSKMKINLHPSGASPVKYYKALSLDLQKDGSYKVESWLSHNLTGNNESMLVIHGLRDGKIGYSGRVTSYINDHVELVNSFRPESLARGLLEKNIDIQELASTSNFHLIACYSGGERGAVQRVADSIGHSIFGYGNNEALRKGVGDMFSPTIYDDYHKVLEPSLYIPRQKGMLGKRRINVLAGI